MFQPHRDRMSNCNSHKSMGTNYSPIHASKYTQSPRRRCDLVAFIPLVVHYRPIEVHVITQSLDLNINAHTIHRLTYAHIFMAFIFSLFWSSTLYGCTHIRTFIHKHIHIHTYAYTYAYTYIYINVQPHTFMVAPSSRQSCGCQCMNILTIKMWINFTIHSHNKKTKNTNDMHNSWNLPYVFLTLREM